MASSNDSDTESNSDPQPRFSFDEAHLVAPIYDWQINQLIGSVNSSPDLQDRLIPVLEEMYPEYVHFVKEKKKKPVDDDVVTILVDLLPVPVIHALRLILLTPQSEKRKTAVGTRNTDNDEATNESTQQTNEQETASTLDTPTPAPATKPDRPSRTRIRLARSRLVYTTMPDVTAEAPPAASASTSHNPLPRSDGRLRAPSTTGQFECGACGTRMCHARSVYRHWVNLRKRPDGIHVAMKPVIINHEKLQQQQQKEEEEED